MRQRFVYFIVLLFFFFLDKNFIVLYVGTWQSFMYIISELLFGPHYAYTIWGNII